MYLARKNIGIPLDRVNRNNHNDNYKELYGVVNNLVDTITDEVYEQIIDGAKLNWKSPVDSENDLPTSANEGDAVMTRDDGKVYRYDGSQWQEIQQIDAGPINEVDRRLSSQLAETMDRVSSRSVSVFDFKELVPHLNVLSDLSEGDWTEAIKQASLFAEEHQSELYFPSLTYNISDKLFVFSEHMKVVGNNATIKLLDNVDIDYIFNFLNGVYMNGLTFDINNNACLSNRAIKTDGASLFENCSFENIYGRGQETDNNEQYFVEVNTTSKKVEFRYCSFENAFNLGDGVAASYGFTGFVFIRGGALAGINKLRVSFENCSFNNTKTIFHDGLTYDEKQDDMDGDAVRCYITNTTNHNKNNLVITFKDNYYERCQKRVYKINGATVYIDRDIINNNESDIQTNPLPGSFGQFRESSVYIKNVDYTSRTPHLAGFVLFDCDIFEAKKSKFDLIERNAEVHLVRNYEGHTTDVTLKEIEVNNFGVIHEKPNSGNQNKIILEDLKITNGLVLTRALGGLEDLVLRNIYIEVWANNVGNDQRTIHYSDIDNDPIVENVEVKEMVRRTPSGSSYPWAIHISNKGKIFNVKMTGDVDGPHSAIRLDTVDGIEVFNCYSRRIHFIGDDIEGILANSITQVEPSQESIRKFNNTIISPWDR